MPPESFGYQVVAAIAAEKLRRQTAKPSPLPLLTRKEAAAMIDAMYAAEDAKAVSQPSKAPKRAKVTTTDEEWLAGLENEPALKGIDIRRELGRAQFWCKDKRRKCTRDFFRNWLLKAERTVQVNGEGLSSTTAKIAMDPTREPAADWRAALCRKHPAIDPETLKDKAWRDLAPDLRMDALRALTQ